MSEAADNINLQMMFTFIALLRYIFSTLSSAENIEYSFLNKGCWPDFKSIAWFCKSLSDSDYFSAALNISVKL